MAFLASVFILTTACESLRNITKINELPQSCVSDSDFENDHDLRRAINKPCVKSWVQAETEKTQALVGAQLLFAKVQNFLKDLTPTNPSPSLSIGNAEI